MTNSVIDELIKLAEQDPLPYEHTSSQWLRYGNQTVVDGTGDLLILKGTGFGTVVSRRSRLSGAAMALERLSYYAATKDLRNYGQIWNIAKQLARELSFDLTHNVWTQAMAMTTVMDHWRAYGLEPRVFALIGDGHGFLGALIKRYFPNSRIYQIDLP